MSNLVTIKNIQYWHEHLERILNQKLSTRQAIAQVLIKAKQNITDPLHWVKGVPYADMKGNPVYVISPSTVGTPDQVKMCALTAIEIQHPLMLLYNNYDLFGAAARLELSCLNLYGVSVVEFNDLGATEHKDVMLLYDNAIRVIQLSENPTI